MLRTYDTNEHLTKYNTDEVLTVTLLWTPRFAPTLHCSSTKANKYTNEHQLANYLVN